MASAPDHPYDDRIHHATAAQLQERRAEKEQEQSDVKQWPWVEGSAGRLLQGLVFGAIFGFLLQKGGVAKFDILVGVLLLENFVVVKVMLSAIVVGMIGVYMLRRLDLIETHIKDTVLGSNILGGLIFGVGFAFIAYCPGTTAAAVGQGNLDALVGVAGLVVGSYLFALASRYTEGTVSTWGKFGNLTLPDLVKAPPGLVIAFLAPLLISVLVLLEIFAL